MVEEKKLVGTIDLTPTWAALLPAILEALENVSHDPAKKQVIREELARMAQGADAYVALQKEGRPDAHHTASTLVAEISMLRREKCELVGALQEARDHYCANNVGGCESSDDVHDARCRTMQETLARAGVRR